jgi:D-sedoheptulose 7-phosphate isomerase
VNVGERTDFLYPFIEGDERDAGSLLAGLAESARAKSDAGAALRAATLDRERETVEKAAREMARRFERGGTLFTFGNGGSSTDAASVARLFARPPDGAQALRARCLVDDSAVLTALANDVGFELVFARQLAAHSTPADIALGVSTSGDSRNLLVAFGGAAARGLLTIGLAGYEGGAMAESADVRHCLVVRSESVHRVQETQAALAFELWRAVRRALADG